MKLDPYLAYYQVYGDIRGGSSWRGASNESGVDDDGIFGDLSGYPSESLEIKPAILYGDM